MIGKIVGNYKVVRVLGEGGVGMVYQGVDTMLDREVAIKVLRPELASQTSVVERFRSEAVTLAKLNHPNIATLYSLFRHGEDLFMVLEFINGETLDGMLFRRGTIPTDEAIPIFCQALEGINYAHERGIVHRDIKPGNMMLTSDGILKVLDFGIARLLGTNRMTRVGNVIGTLEYMSPEQVKGLETDARSDVYGLGILLYEILTGKLPFESENDFELMKMQTEQMPQHPRLLNPEIPVEIEEAILKAIAKNPTERFQSAGDFLNTFLELGFAVSNTTFFNTAINLKKNSQPSKSGLKRDKTEQKPAEATIPIQQSQVPTEPIIAIPMPEIPLTNEIVGEAPTEIKDTKITAKAGKKPIQQSEIKGTRLANSVATNPNERKSTGLGVVESNEISNENYAKSPAFFERLSWVHYASAGGVVVFFLSILTTAAILPFFWGGNVKELPKNIGQKTTEPKNTVATPTPDIQPVVKEKPTQQQTNWNREETTQPTPNATPAITPISDTPQPVQNPPKEREKEREPVKNNPSPPQQQQPKKTAPPPAPKQQKPPTTGKRLRDILTGN